MTTDLDTLKALAQNAVKHLPTPEEVRDRDHKADYEAVTKDLDAIAEVLRTAKDAYLHGVEAPTLTSNLGLLIQHLLQKGWNIEYRAEKGESVPWIVPFKAP